MIIADENLDFRIIKILRENKIEIFSIAEELKGISDKEIIDLAKKTGYVILTEDKDFGEWVFSHKEKNISVVFLRYNHKDFLEISKSLLKLFSRSEDRYVDQFTTITINKIRIRKI